MICPKLLPKVLVVEHLQLMGKGLCGLLAQGDAFDVVGDVPSVGDLIAWMPAPDVILLDIDAMTEDVSDAIRTCKTTLPNARVCVLTAFGQKEMLQRCLAAGADGFIVKDASASEFVRATRVISEGNSYVDPRVAGTLLRNRSAFNGRSDPDELSQREIEIICLIANGYSNRQISAKLKLSEKTIKNYISRVFSKLNISARTQAAAYAFKTGMV
ncbi:MAG: two-component system response regulator DevR [Vulcanimicrobiaceae bacterium]